MSTHTPILVVPWVKPVSTDKEETIRWSIGSHKYEIYMSQLNNIELPNLLEHCIQYRDKIQSVVSVNEDKPVSLFRVFPRTLSTVHKKGWQEIQELIHANPDEATFDMALGTFIAIHTTSEDRHDILNQLRNARKPQNMTVQDFYYRLHEINNYTNWVPGEELTLNKEALKQAFHDAMPEIWRGRFADADKSIQTEEFKNVLHYFKQQETRASRNNAEPFSIYRSSSSHKPQYGHHKYQQFSSNKNSNKRQDSYKNNNNKHVSFANKNDAAHDNKKKKKNDPTSDCLIHPGLHKWGSCYENIRNKQSPFHSPLGAPLNPKTHSATKKTGQYTTGSPKQQALKSAPIAAEPMDTGEDVEMPFNLNGTNNETFNRLVSISDSNVTAHIFAIFPSRNNPQTESNNHTEPYDCADAFNHYMEEMYVLGDNSDKLDSSYTFNSNDNPYRALMDSLKPIGLLKATTIQNRFFNKSLKVLFDTGSERTFIHKRCLTPGTVPSLDHSIDIRTLTGSTRTNQSVILHGVSFPEFSPTKKLTQGIRAFVFNYESPYDMIVGNDVLLPIGFDFLLSIKVMKWLDTTVPWKPLSYFKDPFVEGIINESHCYFIEDAKEHSIDDHFPCFSHYILAPGEKIKQSRYELTPTKQIVDSQQQLLPDQKLDLFKVLDQFQPLFNGNLIEQGRLPTFRGPLVSLELIPDAIPVHMRPYPIASAHQGIFKLELDRLESIGVLSRTGPQEWLAPTFITPKKDGRVRWVSDFRALNKSIIRKVYHLPRIQDILKKRNGYKYFTKIDISMQFYAFELDEKSKNLCSIATPYSNYRYNRLPMGVKQSPDVAQAHMENLLRNLPETDVYIDDIGIFSNTWLDHIESIQKVLTLLTEANFTVNPLKCEWGVQDTDWLGYWLTPQGLKPWQKKIDAILTIDRPQSIKALRSFIGGVTFYRDMFNRRSHILAPLTKQVGQKHLNWNLECQNAFEAIKATIAEQAFLKYPDHNKPFHIYCDASDLQLGAAIFQDNCPVAFYSRKLTNAQHNYTVGEKELLSAVETLKEYRSMLYGAPEIHIYTDHRNNTFQKFNTQRVMRWRLFLEEYSPTFHFIEGEKNTLADMLSRLPFSKRKNDIANNPQDQYHDAELFQSKTQQYDPMDQNSNTNTMAIELSDDLIHCFAHLPDQSGIPFQLDFGTIASAQERDAALTLLKAQQPHQYILRLLAPNQNICCYTAIPNGPLRIYLPDELLENSIRWYHMALSHVGSNRLLDTMSMHFYNKKLRTTIEDITTTCDTCQRYKTIGRGHGELAPREAALIPWQEVAVDCIGPWTLQVAGQALKFSALTIIDTVTNLIEIIRLQSHTAAHVALQFENIWLARYPRPLHCQHDQGGEFTGHAFQQMLTNNGIHDHSTTSRNPQANSLCERMHLVIGNSFRALTTLNPPAGIADANQLIDTAIANAIFAHRSAYNSAIKTTPGGLAFHHDMIMALPLTADLQIIQTHRQQLIDQRLIKANQKRFSYDYRVGQQVLKLAYKPLKMEPRALSGPHIIEQVHANGTISIRLTPFVRERISLRRVKPYRQ